MKSLEVIGSHLAHRESSPERRNLNKSCIGLKEAIWWQLVCCFTPTKSENNEEVDVNKCSKRCRDDSCVFEGSCRHPASLTCASLVPSIGFTLPQSHLSKGCRCRQKGDV